MPRPAWVGPCLLLLLGLCLLGLAGHLAPPPRQAWAVRPHRQSAGLRTPIATPAADTPTPVGALAPRRPATGTPPVPALLAAMGGTAEPKGTIVVIGATGLTGSEVAYQALARGYRVVGLGRNPSKLVVPVGSGGAKGGQAFTDPNLQMVQGSVVNMADVRAAFARDDIVGVVVALGGKTADVGKTMLADGTRNVIEAMQAKGVKRVAVVTSIGVGDSKDQAPFFFRVLMSTVMSGIFKDKNNQEALFTQGPGSQLEYTLVRPGGLTVEPPTGVVNVIEGEAGSIPRADVASFCLDAITEADFPYTGQAPCISSTGGTSWTKDRSAAARGGM